MAGQEDAIQIKGMRLARRLFDYGQSGGRKVHYAICSTWTDIVQALGYEGTLQHALDEPLQAAAQMRDHMAQRQENHKRRALRLWQHSLTKHGRPTSKLFRWLKADQPVVAPTLVVDGEVLTELRQVLAAHREFWETIGEKQELGQPDLQNLCKGLGPGDPITAQQVKEAAKQLQGRAVAGLDRWTVKAIKDLSENSSETLALLFNHAESTGKWPQSILAVRVAFIPKPGGCSTDRAAWRPIAITSALYRLYGKIRLPEVMRAIGPGLHEGVIGGLAGDTFTGQTLRITTYAEAYARGLAIACSVFLWTPASVSIASTGPKSRIWLWGRGFTTG